MGDVCFVSCVKCKKDHEAAAGEMYQSTYFKESKRFAVENFERWFILSAKYGLLEPEQVISPYDLTLNKMGIAERRQWADRVLADIRGRISPNDELTFLTGTRYHEFLVKSLRGGGYTVHIPMEGLRFGEKVQWLQQRNKEISND